MQSLNISLISESGLCKMLSFRWRSLSLSGTDRWESADSRRDPHMPRKSRTVTETAGPQPPGTAEIHARAGATHPHRSKRSDRERKERKKRTSHRDELIIIIKRHNEIGADLYTGGERSDSVNSNGERFSRTINRNEKSVGRQAFGQKSAK